MEQLDRKLYPFSVKVRYYGDGDFDYIVYFDNVKEVKGVDKDIDKAIEDAFYNLDAWLSYCKEEGIQVEQFQDKKEEEYSGRVTLRMPQRLHKDIADLANKDGISLNYMINDAIRFYLTYKTLDEVKKLVSKKLDVKSTSSEPKIKPQKLAL